MFVFYFANLSAITPPVAVAALVGANIAKASFWPTAFNAVRLGLPGFLLPFLFLFEPQIIGIEGTLLDQLIAIAQALIATAALNFAIEGRLFTRLSWPERVILFAAAFGLIYWLTWVELVSLAIVIAIAARSYFADRAAVAKSEA
jgi:TRAP-type uncharacterized transport system fused permease subunit